MAICIPAEIIEKVKDIVSKEETSIKREAELTKLLGDNVTAKDVNLLYEKSLLLVHQKLAADRFIENISKEGAEGKAILKEKIAQRFKDRTEKIQQEELLTVAQEIYNKKYKLDISLEDMQVLNKIKIERDALKEKMEGTEDGSIEKMEYGRKAVEMSEFINDLKNPAEKFGFFKTIKSMTMDELTRFEKEKGVIGNMVEAVNMTFDISTSAIAKSFNAAADMSYALKQGLRVFSADKKIWKDAYVEAFKPFRHLTNKEAQIEVFNEFKARLVSNDLYQTAMESKLSIGVIEDYFPTTLAEKLPLVGNVFKASNEAFTMFSQGSRMSLFENLYNKHIKEMTPELAKDLAELSNSISGRGNLGKLEGQSGLLNRLFYSARYIKSTVDLFYKPFDMKLDPIARMEARRHSIKHFSTIATMMYFSSLFTDVGTNPIDSRFGKARIPGTNRWVDLTAGAGSYVTLASRLATGKSMSSSGKITDLSSGRYKSMTKWDVATNWGTNKLAPAPSALVQYLKGRDYSGKKPKLSSSLFNMYSPMSMTNIYEFFNDENETGNVLDSISAMLDIQGMSVSDYDKYK